MSSCNDLQPSGHYLHGSNMPKAVPQARHPRRYDTPKRKAGRADALSRSHRRAIARLMGRSLHGNWSPTRKERQRKPQLTPTSRAETEQRKA
ncbi:hypothetical protein XA68_13572 [Ophiocordyceps unilateralis]|uniref:Uncharacterized protein n=1 Tax=Ophiocordyceps unilateralis TaxID=268505 RepID=A0A2A9PAU4_OPHUN|nr:hypothetical protein XA68_13572 [Ophiocordyceps unilateralis]